MWFTIALREINDIPAGTLLKITKCYRNTIYVETCSSPIQRVGMHQPAWWLKDIGFHPNMYKE